MAKCIFGCEVEVSSNIGVIGTCEIPTDPLQLKNGVLDLKWDILTYFLLMTEDDPLLQLTLEN